MLSNRTAYDINAALQIAQEADYALLEHLQGDDEQEQTGSTGRGLWGPGS